MLQSYMHHELNHNRWEAFRLDLKETVLSFVKIKELHETYLHAARGVCFQTPTTRRLLNVRAFFFGLRKGSF